MTEPTHEHVSSRAELLPEETHAGSDDPQAQAEAILQESGERTEDPGHPSVQQPDARR